MRSDDIYFSSHNMPTQRYSDVENKLHPIRKCTGKKGSSKIKFSRILK